MPNFLDDTMTGFYDFYTTGKWNGKGPTLVMFRTYRADRTFHAYPVDAQRS